MYLSIQPNVTYCKNLYVSVVELSVYKHIFISDLCIAMNDRLN